MHGDATLPPTAIHASAVAIGARALLIAGRSGAGKSRLALALVASSRPHRAVTLVGDDRVLLDRDAHGHLRARPHPRIAGFVERRGLGLVATAWRRRAVVAALLELGDGDTFASAAFETLPLLRLAGGTTPVDVPAVLAWWRRVTRTAA